MKKSHPTSSTKSLQSELSINRSLRLKSESDSKSRSSAISYSSSSKSDKRDASPVIEGRDIAMIWIIPNDVEILCCKLSPDQNLIALGLCDGSIHLYNLKSKDIINKLKDDDLSRNSCVLCIRFIQQVTHKHILVASYATGQIKFWDLISFGCLSTIFEKRQIFVITPNVNFTKLAASGSDCIINIYDTSNCQLITSLSSSLDLDISDGHSQRVFAAECHPINQNELITGGWDRSVRFWDDRQLHSTRFIYGPFICGEGLSINDYGTKIATGSWRSDDAIEIWDYNNGGKLIGVQPDDVKSFLYCCKWMENDKYMVTAGGNENLVRVINCNYGLNQGTIKNFPQAVYSFDWKMCHETYILSASCAKCCYVMGFSP